MGIYDLPTQIGLVARMTEKAGKIIYIGHSMGTTGAFVYASEYSKEAQKHLGAIIALAPVAYTHNSFLWSSLEVIEPKITVRMI